MKSILIAFAMYSRFPTPRAAWDEKSLSWALCAFPLVGALIGAALWVWLWLWDTFSLLGALGAAVAVALPIWLSGGIHMDGFCDVCDALGSHQPRERKLEILKDSHAGAFAIVACALYLMIFYAAWREVPHRAALALSPVLSRCLSALAAVSWKNARGSGLLASFTAPMDARRAKRFLLALTALTMTVMTVMDGESAVLASALVFFYYHHKTFREFGGVTGDTEGWFLQLCELAQVLALALEVKLL